MPTFLRLSNSSRFLPADAMPSVLLVEPLLERREIIEDGRGIDIFFAGHGFERFGPRMALSHLKHFCQLRARGFVAVNRAAIQRSGITRFAAQRAVKLELHHE